MLHSIHELTGDIRRQVKKHRDSAAPQRTAARWRGCGGRRPGSGDAGSRD
jgi:hypothetical protein